MVKKIKNEEIKINNYMPWVINFFNKDKIFFEFYYIDNVIHACDEELNRDDKRFCLETVHEYEDYEKYLYIKYLKDYIEKIIEQDEERNEYFGCDFILRNIIDNDYKYISKIIKPKKFSLMCLKSIISKNSFIQNKLQETYKNNGYPKIDKTCFYRNKQIIQLIKKHISYLLEDLNDYLKVNNLKELKKSWYSINLEEICNLLNVNKKSNTFKWINQSIYSKVSIFKRLKFEARPDLDFIENHKFMLDGIRENPNEYKLDENFICDVFRKYSSLDILRKNYISKIKKTNLKPSDYEHINEFNYIKELLSVSLKEKKKGINILLWGKPGTGKTELAKLLIQEIKADGYIIDKNSKYDDITRQRDVSCLDYNFSKTKCILKNKPNSIILFDEAEDFFYQNNFNQDKNLLKSSVNDLLTENVTPVIWTTNSLYDIQKSFLRRFTYILEMNDMPKDAYVKMFNKMCKKYNIAKNDKLLDICYDNSITPGILDKAFVNYTSVINKKDDDIIEDIKNIYKAQSFGFSELKIVNHTNRPKPFDSKLLNTSDDLEEFAQKMKKLKRTDFSLLLYGVSGSGKTYYADYLSKVLNMKLIRKKASDLESMWVGETERNIAEAFKEAKNDKAILVIDEGDHFISERSNHMRSWETSRTEEMLQQIEMHPYPVIFTTNLINNVDKAAMRRFTYKIKFDYLTKEQIKIAWKDYFPKAKLPNDIHLSKLCPGDFATVYKKAEFEDYLTNSDKLYKKLQEEQEMKKEMEDYSIKL